MPIPGSITKGVISLLKKGSRHVWQDLDNYRPVTLLNTDGEETPALRSFPFVGLLSTKVSTYADDISVFVPHSLSIKAVK